MPDFPLHPTLFFSLSIILALVLSYFFTLADMIDKKDKKFIMVNLFLYGAWTVAALFALYIVHLIETDTKRAVAFAPLGMMIAALIASASVMKNISATRENEELKHKRDTEKEDKKFAKEDSKFYLEKCIAYLKEVDLLIGNRQNNPLSWKLASDILRTIQKIYPKITEESHKSIFLIECNTASFKLLQSFVNDEQGATDIITTSFFCSMPYDKNITVNDEYIKDITNKINIIHPNTIIPIFQFMQQKDNQFLTKYTNNSQWKNLDIEALKKNLPWPLVTDYLELYKKNIPE